MLPSSDRIEQPVPDEPDNGLGCRAESILLNGPPCRLTITMSGSASTSGHSSCTLNVRIPDTGYRIGYRASATRLCAWSEAQQIKQITLTRDVQRLTAIATKVRNMIIG